MSVLTVEPTITRSSTDNEFDGYYTIEVKPLRCPGCKKIMNYVELDEYHVIVVWEEMDDVSLLITAAELKKQDFNPKVVAYESGFGKCMDYYVARERGLVE